MSDTSWLNLIETSYGMQLDFQDAGGTTNRLAERHLDDGSAQLVLSSPKGPICVLGQEMVKALLPYLQEFAATSRFGRRPIQRAFTDPRIEKLAETDPLLASVRQHVLSQVEDDAGAVHALVRLLMAYSETLAWCGS